MNNLNAQDTTIPVTAGLVSIMMPAYNAQKYIAQSIDTIIAQSYTHWELIIVNDGSTDETVNIVTPYTSDARIKLVHQKNEGEASARNTALNHMQGEFVAFLDADDLYMPNALADRVDFLTNHSKYGVVVSDGHFLTDAGEIVGQLSEIRPIAGYNGNILEILVLSPSIVGPPIGMVMRRALVEQLGLRFDPAVGYGTDWDFWTELARHTEFGYIDALTHYYRIHQTNMTRSTGRQKIIKDWLYGRMKVFNSAWFDELSADTRKSFFHNLLINLLADQPEQQQAILNSEKFSRLPASIQAQIWRHLGISYLQEQSNKGFAVQCIKNSVAINPGDNKSRWLLRSLTVGALPTIIVLRLWQVVHRMTVQARSVGNHKAKPVPAQLNFVSK